MNEEWIPATVSDQYKRTLMMFREAVSAFPADEWRTGDSSYQRPAGVALHVVQTIDYYTSGKTEEEFPWGYRFKVDWENEHSELLPTQDELNKYFNEMEANLSEWFMQTDMSASEETYKWTGETKLGHAIYVLRHTHHHTAEMLLELHRRGYKAPVWR